MLENPLEALVQEWKSEYLAGENPAYWICANELAKALADLPTFEIGD